MGDVLEKLLAIQNAPQLIEEVRGEGVTTLAQSSNFSQVMFNTDRPDNGFFDDDDDDDDDIGIAYPMGDGEGSMEADFAQFDAFSATMQLSGGGSDSGSDNDAGSFSFASFDDPNVFTSSASSSSGAAALPSTQHGVQATGEKLGISNTYSD